MKEIIVTTQEEFDRIKEIKADEFVIVKAALKLNCKLSVFGNLRFELSVDCSFYENRFVEARGNSSVEARDNSSVEALENSSVVARGKSSVVARGKSSVVARGNSSVVAWGNSSVEARDNSSVEALENSSVVAWGKSSVVARDNSSVVARGKSSVVARGKSSVVARGNSSVVAWDNSSVDALENSSVVALGNSSVVAWGNSCARLFSEYARVTLFGFSVGYQMVAKEIEKKSETSTIIKPVIKNGLESWLDREGIENKSNVILFKKVSKDFKTQEGTKNETLWAIGTTISHPSWDPTKEECGEGKSHACSRPYFCDEFRNEQGDVYIAIEIAKKDLYPWKNASYPHKIAFRKGKVLYRCDRFGKEIKEAK